MELETFHKRLIVLEKIICGLAKWTEFNLDEFTTFPHTKDEEENVPEIIENVGLQKLQNMEQDNSEMILPNDVNFDDDNENDPLKTSTDFDIVLPSSSFSEIVSKYKPNLVTETKKSKNSKQTENDDECSISSELSSNSSSSDEEEYLPRKRKKKQAFNKRALYGTKLHPNPAKISNKIPTTCSKQGPTRSLLTVAVPFITIANDIICKTQDNAEISRQEENELEPGEIPTSSSNMNDSSSIIVKTEVDLFELEHQDVEQFQRTTSQLQNSGETDNNEGQVDEQDETIDNDNQDEGANKNPDYKEPKETKDEEKRIIRRYQDRSKLKHASTLDDLPLEMIPSRKGNAMLERGGYLYHQAKVGKNNLRMWRCALKLKDKCPARLNTTFDMANLNVVYQLGDHNHDPLSPEEIEAKKSASFEIFDMTKEYRKELLNKKEKK